MKVFTYVLIFLSGISTFSGAQIVLEKPLSSRQTGYHINARLHPDKKTVEGEMTAFWVNMSDDDVADVQMHLYMNAFYSRKSTFYKEMPWNMDFNEKDAGWIDMTSLSGKNGDDLSGRINYISPDDGNPDDRTVIRIDLPEPCKPGDTVKLKIKFLTKLPSEINRTGASGKYFFVAQWFPKFGVYETAGMRYATKGGWNCHQFHRNSEFYSNHSVYDVNISVPKEYVTGSCGLLIDEKQEGDSTRTLTYRAEDIVDFAWTAWPGYKVYSDQWKNVKITLLLPSEREKQAPRQLQAVKNGLEYLDDHVGPYPWPYVTVVDPPSIGNGAGGMEYTTLFTSTSFYGMPASIHMPEMVTIHEFGHAYFMGILASNEFEEPWLDEGINTYWEGRIVDNYYGRKSGLLDHYLLKVPDTYLARTSYIGSESRQAVSNIEFSWNYPHGTYGMMSYHKASVILETLTGLVGEKKMDEIFQEYYRQWAFRHPSGRDFINVVNDVVTRIPGWENGMDWFFDQTLYGTEICDYRVEGFRNEKMTGDDENTADSLYRSVVELERMGGVKLPEEILVHFKGGNEITEHWDGIARTKEYRYEGTPGIEWVKLDPDYKIRMDINYTNNSMTDNPDRVPVRRISSKLVSFMQFFISFITL